MLAKQDMALKFSANDFFNQEFLEIFKACLDSHYEPFNYSVRL